MNGLTNFFESRAADLNDTFARATAVISIGKLWRDDPLYTAARGANVRVVDIDATKPWSTSLEGVSVALEPIQDAPWSDEASAPERRPSVYFWLSPANAVRAAEIIAGDLARLVPENRGAIATNLQRVRRELLELKRDYEVKFADLPDVTVFSLAPEFVYLTSDMGLYVDGYFFKQDLDWTDDDLTAFGRYLSDNAIPVVLHKYEPAESIVAAIDTAGAKLVVLETLDAGVVENGQLLANSYFALLQSNLASLYQALRDAQ